jgi:hypothetical protein
MDPKGKGMVINDKEKETLYVDEPKGDKPTDSGSSHKKRDEKKKRRIKKIIYYDNDASFSSSRDDDEEDSSSKRKRLIKTIHFGVIKCAVTYFLSILVFGKLLKMECISIVLTILYLLMSKYIKMPKLLLCC